MKYETEALKSMDRRSTVYTTIYGLVFHVDFKIVRLVSLVMGRTNWLKGFFVLLVAFTGYRLGRRSCDYACVQKGMIDRRVEAQLWIKFNYRAIAQQVFFEI